MPDLNQLMTLEGALAAFEFTDRGELVESIIEEGSPLNDQVLDLLSHVCVANESIASMQARGWEGMTEAEGFYPVQGVTMIGFDWSAVAVGNYGVLLKNEGADYQAAYGLLAQ